jgi:hypothetical protein
MKILHILRTEPDEMTIMFINETSQGNVSKEIPLYQGEVDYDLLLEEICESDKVISWW